MTHTIQELTYRLLPLTTQVTEHPLYQNINSIADLQLFMGEHVFAVWDFMCLLKELQRRLVCTSAPWFPPKDAMSANLINSILVEEEGDITEDGNYASHYEIYISAMEKIGANTQPIKKFLTSLLQGNTLEAAIQSIHLQSGTKNFILTTFSFFQRPIHELAAAFVYGREGVTAAMFTPLLEQLEKTLPSHEKAKLSTLIFYFKRHITLDNDEHFPKALQMLFNLVGNDEQKIKDVEQAAIRALDARIAFFSDIQYRLQQKTLTSVSL